MGTPTPKKPEFAHYYGDWIWDEELTGWVKSLLLFFDGIALALPRESASRIMESNLVLAQPLADIGLLRNFDPDQWLKPTTQVRDKYGTAPERIITRLLEIMTRAEGEPLNESVLWELEELLGGDDNIYLRDSLARAVAMLADANKKYPDPPNLIRSLAVAMTTRLLSVSVNEVAIEPVIDDQNAASFVASIIGSHDAGRARIVTGDLAQIGIDLSAVPLDEVLDFRSQYGSEYRAYSSDVRKFVLELSLMDEADRHSAVLDRRAELDDRAEQLRKLGRTAFARQAIGFGFGLAGAAWTLVHGDPWGAAFAAAGASAGLTRQDPEPIGASYTYILQAKTELTH